MRSNTTQTNSWPSLAIGLYNELTRRGAEITYEASDVEVMVPDRIGADAEHTKWLVNGTVKIRTRDLQDR